MNKNDLENLVIELRTDIKWIKENLNKKASRWVEVFVKGMIGAILLSVLGAIMGFVFVGGAVASIISIIN